MQLRSCALPTLAAHTAGRTPPAQALNHCYELLAGCVRSAEDISPEMKARFAVVHPAPPWVLPSCLAEIIIDHLS